MSLAATSPWSVLVEKARQQAGRTRQELQATQSRLEGLQASLARIAQLIAEYQRQDLASDGQSRSMRERLNTRAFIAQLQTASGKLATEVDKMTGVLAHLRVRLQRDEQEVLKMEKLAENAWRAERRELQRREQKGFDELALLRRQWSGDPAT